MEENFEKDDNEEIQKFLKTIQHERQAELITRKVIHSIRDMADNIIKSGDYEKIEGPDALKLVKIGIDLAEIKRRLY